MRIFIFYFLIISLNSISQNDIYKAYNNYDFIPGENILFEDNFTDSKIGEFPPRWKLISQQGVINKIDSHELAYIFTESTVGTMGKIAPRIKNLNYLTDNFTIEEDFYLPEEEVVAIYFIDENNDDGKFISIEANGTIKNNYFTNDLSSIYPNGEILSSKWHHLSIACKGGQMKIYIDQHRVLVIPNLGFTPKSLYFGGSLHVKIKNIKIAEGGDMNLLGKIITEGKFVSYAIKFDISKSQLKGESIGFLNQMIAWLKDNQTIKLEIGGYCDSDGDDTFNLKLSEQRANAVRDYLILNGIKADRLKAKGYGELNPIGDNLTSEGKSKNRRVEFIKI